MRFLAEQVAPTNLAAPFSALVVEDDPGVRKLLMSLLESLGFVTRSCSRGDEAWQLLDEQASDLLITDWIVPGLSGPDLIHRIRLSERFPGLYVLIVTGRADSVDRVEGLEAGADDFVAKPFDLQELRVRIRAGQRIVRLQKTLLAHNQRLNASNDGMTKELAAAADLQRALIPATAPRLPGFDCAWAFHPYGQGSGDMFGIYTLDENHVGMFLVDVSGHGMAAAMLASTVARLLTPVPGQDSLVKRRLTRPPFYELVPPVRVLDSLRGWFKHDETGSLYFTMIYAVLDARSGELEWVSAGHPPPIHVRGSAWHRHGDQCAQTPVGLPIAPRGEARSNHLSLAPGERVFFYSDGVEDLRAPGGHWLPEDALGGTLAKCAQLSIGDCVRSTIGQLRRRAVTESFGDDVTLVALARESSQGPGRKPL